SFLAGMSGARWTWPSGSRVRYRSTTSEARPWRIMATSSGATPTPAGRSRRSLPGWHVDPRAGATKGPGALVTPSAPGPGSGPPGPGSGRRATMERMAPYLVHGLTRSYFTRKVTGYLDYTDRPWRLEPMPPTHHPAATEAGWTGGMPVVTAPDGELMWHSTTVIEH